MASYAFSYGLRAMPVSLVMNPGNEFQVQLSDGTRAPSLFISTLFLLPLLLCKAHTP